VRSGYLGTKQCPRGGGEVLASLLLQVGIQPTKSFQTWVDTFAQRSCQIDSSRTLENKQRIPGEEHDGRILLPKMSVNPHATFLDRLRMDHRHTFAKELGLSTEGKKRCEVPNIILVDRSELYRD
jgi:hypothetical protein